MGSRESVARQHDVHKSRHVAHVDFAILVDVGSNELIRTFFRHSHLADDVVHLSCVVNSRHLTVACHVTQLAVLNQVSQGLDALADGSHLFEDVVQHTDNHIVAVSICCITIVGNQRVQFTDSIADILILCLDLFEHSL